MPSEFIGEVSGNKVLRISMLGRIELRVGDICIDDSINRSRKMWNMLAFIVNHRDRPISQQEFIDNLWGDEDNQNPINALKTLLYRIRILIAPLEQEYGEEFILSQRGSYSWNSSVRCEVDTEIFEQLCRSVNSDSLSDMGRTEIYEKIQDLYKGDFLPKLGMEFWVLPLCTHYHALYLSMAKRYAKLLERGSQHERMGEVCSKALAIDNFDEELHCLKIISLIRQGKDTDALAHYETATDQLYRNLGVRPSDAMRSLYTEIMDAQHTMETDLTVIQNQLKENNERPGAFVCEYGFFKLAYRLESRRALRSGLSVFLGLVTVSTDSDEQPKLSALNDVMDKLLEMLRDGLRKGDIISRYSSAQYVIMLPALTFEDGDRVLNRVVGSFYRMGRRYQGFKLHYKLQQLEIEQD